MISCGEMMMVVGEVMISCGEMMTVWARASETIAGARGRGDGLGYSHPIFWREMPGGRSPLGLFCR